MLDTAVKRILEQVYRYRDVKGGEHIFDRSADHKKAADIAKECMVLLKNDGALPLPHSNAKIAFIGAFLRKIPEYRAAAVHTSTPRISQTHLTAPQNIPTFPMPKDMSVNQTIQTLHFLRRLYSLPQTVMLR